MKKPDDYLEDNKIYCFTDHGEPFYYACGKLFDTREEAANYLEKISAQDHKEGE